MATVAQQNPVTAGHQQQATKLEPLRLCFTQWDSLRAGFNYELLMKNNKENLSSKSHGSNPERNVVSNGTSTDFCQSIDGELLVLPQGEKK